MTLLDRFLKYVSFDTQSDPASAARPSTPGQSALLEYLADEMCSMGMSEVELNSRGYLTASVPATKGFEGEPVIGFLAHVDTSPDASGANIRPQLTERDGDTVITSDGTTLLGADDKAGVAIIMTFAETLLSKDADQRVEPLPGTPHGKIRIAFTSDEEIGSGVDGFDVEAFGADFAYTVDGGAEGELEYENFNAAEAVVTIRGRSAHPDDARGKMINASRVAMEFDAGLPQDQRPETTGGREGFYHLTRLDGAVENAAMEYILRDFESAGFDDRKKTVMDVTAKLNNKYGAGTVQVILEDQYRNMREVLERRPDVVERARRAMRAAGVVPVEKPIRGGTDGARLSWMGLPCPNLFTGGIDFHSTRESVSLSAMQKAVNVLIEIVNADRR